MPIPSDAAAEHLVVESRQRLRQWLAAHHADAPAVWVVTWKASSGGPYVPYEDIVEEALCFGWVDSKVRRLDDARTSTLLTPRRHRSAWSASNVARVDRLTAAGLMAPAGLAAVERAKADGRWPTS